MKCLLKSKGESNRPALPINVEHTDGEFIEIRPEGYGECEAIDGGGAPVLIELYDGELRVLVFGDIHSPDPTHTISLEGAKESLRKKEPTVTYRLRKFLEAEVANEAHGGDSPTTLGSALDSLNQMPDTVLADLLGETTGQLANSTSIHAELEALIQHFGRDLRYPDGIVA